MIFDNRSASNIMDPEFPVDSYSRPEQRIGYAGAGTGQPPNSLIGEGETTMNNLSMISRDWRRGLVEFASIGYDYSPPNPAARWIVITGRTASGKAMERTDEPMIITSERHFASDHEASAWQAQWIAGPIGNCKCGKPISHLDADEDSTEWACRVPRNRPIF